MNILMLLEGDFPPDIRVEHEVIALVNAGHSVTVATNTLKDKAASDVWNGADVRRRKMSTWIHKSSVGALKFPFYHNFWRSFCNELFEKQTYDAIHVHDLPLAKVGREFADLHHIPFLLDLHENWPGLLQISEHTQTSLGKLLSSQNQWEAYEQKMVASADVVITVIDESSDRLSKMPDADPEKIYTVSNTPIIEDLKVDVENDSKQDESRLILFYGGGVNKHRGLQYVLQAIKKAGRDDIECWVVGDGRYLNTLQEMASELDVNQYVRLWGWKPFKEMNKLMSESDILIIPHMKTSHSDSTIPHKLFQYMYTNKPILASDCDPIERIVNETSAGEIYHYNDIEQLADKISMFAEMKASDKSLTTNARDAVENVYNWKHDAATLTRIYENLNPA